MSAPRERARARRFGWAFGGGTAAGAACFALLAGVSPAHGAVSDPSPRPVPVKPVPVDSSSAPPGDAPPQPDLLHRLQEEDDAFFPAELLEGNPSLRDSTLARLDSLGYTAYRREAGTRSGPGALHFGPAARIMDFNRAEGLVAGLGVSGSLAGRHSPRIHLEGAYAGGSKKFRHLEALVLPLVADPDLRLVARASYADRVVPFGASRPAANAVRAFLGGADDRDYLRRRGGSAGVRLEWEGLALTLDYEAARESAPGLHEDFSLFGVLDQPLTAATGGLDRAAVVGVDVGRGAWRGWARHRVAGGALGGDFAYNRTDLELSGRRYLGRQELTLDLTAVHTAGRPPVQRTADLGGLGSVRGFDRRTRLGETALGARFEVHVPYDVLAASGVPVVRDLHLQFVPFADGGRVWNGASDAWLLAPGLGVQYYLGPFERVSYLRLDAAVPLGPDRPEDLRLYLRFARGLF